MSTARSGPVRRVAVRVTVEMCGVVRGPVGAPALEVKLSGATSN